MSENILEVKGLTKDYGDFVLDKLTFTVPKGVIMAFVLPSNYSLGVNAGFATMFILIILLVVLGLWTKATNNSIMWFVVENFEVSIAIAGVSVVAICGLSFVLSNLFFRKKYI